MLVYGGSESSGRGERGEIVNFKKKNDKRAVCAETLQLPISMACFSLLFTKKDPNDKRVCVFVENTRAERQSSVSRV